jgi:hypothetical protein
MNLDAGTVDEQLIGRILGSCQSAEDGFPYAALGPTHEAVVECLLRSVDVGAVSPSTATAQRMNDPAQYTTIIHALLAAHASRQKRRDPTPLRIRKPKEIRHLIASSSRQ